MSHPVLRSCTPLLAVEAIEPSLPFWEGLGFTASQQVTHGEGLGFVILTQGPVELMLQTHGSIADDDAELAAGLSDATSQLFVRVADLDAVIVSLGDAEVIMARRKTFYGSMEIGVRTPGGHQVTFAQF